LQGEYTPHPRKRFTKAASSFAQGALGFAGLEQERSSRSWDIVTPGLLIVAPTNASWAETMPENSAGLSVAAAKVPVESVVFAV
jgi:hypothetical protein